jgi:hypothetical protein
MSGVLNLLLAGAASAIKDAYFNLTTLLLNTSSTNGAQNNTFLDSSTNNFTITRNGNTTQGTFTPFSQTGWSNYFNGSSTISFGTSSATNILAYDTFECWVNMPVIGTNDLIAGKDGNFWMGYNFTGIGGTANKFVFSIWTGSSWQAVSSTTTPVVGVWYHLLGVKDNTTMRFYVNGVQENTSTFSGSPVTTGTFYVASNNNIENFEGYISNLRLITGASNTVFPYSGLTTGSSFTPPTSALTAVTGTALLTCQSNRFVDNSSNNLSATIISIPSVQAFSPFAPTAAYDTAVVGGSAFFDGTGDNLTWSGTAAGSGAFSYEFWLYSLVDFSSNRAPLGVLAISGYNGALDVRMTTTTINMSAYNVANNNFTVPTLVPYTWYHVVLCRNSSNQATVFLNGVRSSTGAVTISQNFSGLTSVIGAQDAVSSPGERTTGYLSDVRLIVGSTPYDPTASTITVPTAPLTAITNTQLLTKFTNTGIFDSTAKNVLETVGNAQVSTTQAKWGTTSLYLDGTGDYLVAPANQLYSFGTGDFTIECWIRLISVNSAKMIVTSGYDSSTGGGGWGFVHRADISSLMFTCGSNVTYTKAWSPTANTWYHVAVSRSGTNIRLFVDGTQIGTTSTSSDNITSTSPLVVGGNLGGGANLTIDAYIDDLRITKGYARYTANFTAPTAAFPLL